MSDPVPAAPVPASTPAPAPAPEVPAPPPAKKPGVLRKSAFIILAVVILVLAVILPFWADHWVRNAILTALDDRGLELSPDSRLSVSVLGLRLTGAGLQVREKGKSKDAPVFTADLLNAKIALLDSISSGDAIIDDLTLEGVKGDLRRRADGQPPLSLGEDKTAAPGQSRDWLGMAKQGMEWWRNRKTEEDQQASPKPGTPPPPPKPVKTVDQWHGAALRYEPSPRPDASGHWHLPRVLVRKLSLKGTSFGLPDETPLDIVGFSLQGTMISLRLHADEVMTLTGEILTSGAGPMTLAMERKGGAAGSLKLKAPKLPVEAIANPKVSGDSLSHYGAKGLADLDLATTWTSWDLLGTATSKVQNLSLSPDKEAGERAAKVASVVNNLKDQTIVWPVKLGGTLYAPTVTDSGVEAVISGSALDAAKALAKQKADEEADKLKGKAVDKLDQQLGDKLKDQPAAKGAVDKAKDLFKGFGK